MAVYHGVVPSSGGFYGKRHPQSPGQGKWCLRMQSAALTSSQVFLITGGAVGIGYECAKILYSKDATVYIAGRSKGNAEKAIDDIKQTHNTSKGNISFLYLDLGDLRTIKPAAEEIMAKEERVDVLWNNAGVMVPPPGSKTTQVKRTIMYLLNHLGIN